MSALAAAAPCPDMPAVYGGTDDTVLQLNAMRREAVTICEGDRESAEDVQGATHADLWFLVGLIAALFAGSVVMREWLAR